jgi:mycobactin polyketide synthetase MbtD
MLDAMAYRLRADGVDCVSVQWGQWQINSAPAESGLAKLTFTGLLPMSAAEALALGMSPLRSNALVAAFDLDRARSVLGACGQAALVSELSAPAPDAAPPAATRAEPMDLSQRLISLLAEAIGADSTERIDTTIPMVAIGLDSLQALELRRRVQLEFDHDLEVSDLLGGASIADVLMKLEA